MAKKGHQELTENTSIPPLPTHPMIRAEKKTSSTHKTKNIKRNHRETKKIEWILVKSAVRDE